MSQEDEQRIRNLEMIVYLLTKWNKSDADRLLMNNLLEKLNIKLEKLNIKL